MKKVILGSVLVMLLVVTTGCGNTEKQKSMSCSRTGTIASGTTFEYNYKVDYTGKYVDVINIEEKLVSDNSEYLETVKESVEEMYSKFDGIKYHGYDVEVTNSELISHRYIDYKHIDTDKMLEVDSAFAAIIKDGKVAVSDVKAVYEQLGLTCK